DYYRQLYSALLAEIGLHPDGAGQYRQTPVPAATRRKTERLLARSRARGRLRWPQHMVTVDTGLEVAIEKIERAHGVRIELTDRERRWPLLFGWPKYFALKRKGVVK